MKRIYGDKVWIGVFHGTANMFLSIPHFLVINCNQSIGNSVLKILDENLFSFTVHSSKHIRYLLFVKLFYFYDFDTNLIFLCYNGIVLTNKLYKSHFIFNWLCKWFHCRQVLIGQEIFNSQ